MIPFVVLLWVKYFVYMLNCCEPSSSRVFFLPCHRGTYLEIQKEFVMVGSRMIQYEKKVHKRNSVTCVIFSFLQNPYTLEGTLVAYAMTEFYETINFLE